MRKLKLTQGYYALVDNNDYQRVSKFKWSAMKTPNTVYAQRGVRLGVNRWKIQLLHRFIMGVTDSKIQIDHKDRDGLHNWRENLRVATPSQNMMNRSKQRNNTSGETGVRRVRGRWRAEIKCQRKTKYLGEFLSKAKAVRVRRAAAVKIHKDFRRTP